MSQQAFQFKQFQIQQDRCAMKVGTDGVLLGSWASVEHLPETVLDIGSGTGLLALMLAQRIPHAFIEAIEIDPDAYEQCTENFEASPWADRLFCYHAALLEFVEEVEDVFDLIICNPPFYNPSHKSGDSSRDLARFQDAMPFEHLIYAVRHLLSQSGRFATIIPHESAEGFTHLAHSAGLQLNRCCVIKGTPESNPKRQLLEFSFNGSNTKIETLIIETERHKYTDKYIALTKEFYLKM